MQQTDPREALWCLFQEQAQFVIGNATEIEHPQAWKTDYVSTLKDGKTKNLCILLWVRAIESGRFPVA